MCRRIRSPPLAIVVIMSSAASGDIRASPNPAAARARPSSSDGILMDVLSAGRSNGGASPMPNAVAIFARRLSSRCWTASRPKTTLRLRPSAFSKRGARVVRAAAGLDVRRDELALAPLEADGVAEVDLLALEQRRGRDDLEQARSGVLGLATHVPFLAARRPREDAPRLDVAHQHRAARRLGGVEQLVDRLLKGRVDGEADLGVIRARRLRAGALQLDGLELHRRLVAVFLGERVRRRHGERGDEGEGDGCSAHQPPM
jgi:hypothetical protein